MKKFLITLIIFLSCSIAFAQQAVHREHFSKIVRDSAGVPLAFRLKPEIEITGSTFFQTYREQFSLRSTDSMDVISPSFSPDSTYTFEKFQQYYSGLKVIGGEFTIVKYAGRVRKGFGRIIPNLDVDTKSAVIGDKEVKNRARDAIAKLENIGMGRIAFADEPEINLVIAPQRGSWSAETYRLAFQVKVRSLIPSGRYIVYIDASTGAILAAYPLDLDVWTNKVATGQTPPGYYGDVDIIAQEDPEQEDGKQWRLRSDYPFKVETYESDDSTAVLGEDFFSAYGYFINTNSTASNPIAYGVSAHWIAQKALDYFQLHFNHYGVGGNGEGIRNMILIGPAALNVAARSVGYKGYSPNNDMAILQFGLKWPLPQYCVPLDVVGHEVAHAVMSMTSELNTDGESGALSESFADIFGTLLEFWILPEGSANWSIAEDCSWTRYLDNPKSPSSSFPSCPCPNTYQGTLWKNLTSPTDDSGIHINSGVQNFWFYLLSMGGSGTIDDIPNGTPYSVDAIGKEKTAQIVYYTMTTLPSHADYAIAVAASEVVAILLFGEYSQEHKSTVDAWYAVNAPGAAYVMPHQAPLDGAVNIPAWPVRFEWERDPGVSRWELQIDTDVSVLLTSSQPSIPVNETAKVNNVEVAFAEFVLAPDTKYFWRVRSIKNGEPLGWRPVSSFTTSTMIPSPSSPNNAQQSHPWKLPFVFNDVGTAHYEIEVFSGEDACKNLVFPRKQFNLDAIDMDMLAELTVPVNAGLSWRVRSKSDAAGKYVSKWSECIYFKTLTPQAVAVSSLGDEYPWPVAFEWEPVIGATFSFEIAGKNTKYNHRVDLPEEVTTYEKNLPVSFWVDDIRYDWWVDITGPPWGSETEPELESTREKGQPTAKNEFRINGNDTVVDNHSPDWANGQKVCFVYGYEPTTFSWDPVPNAVSYAYSVYEMRCPLTDPATPCFHWSEVYSGTTTETTVEIPDVVTTPDNHNDHVGFVWKVVAYNNDNEPGLGLADEPNAEYFIFAATPKIVSPINESVKFDGQVTLTWSSKIAHGGGFVLYVYEGGNCTGDLHTGVSLIRNSHGTNTKTVSGFDPNQTYSWRLRPWMYDSLCDDPSWHWSTCGQFHALCPTMDAPDVISLGGGVIGSMIAIFSHVEHADHYKVEVRQNSAAGPLVGDFDFYIALLQQHEQQILLALNSQPPLLNGWHVAIISGTQQVNRYYFRVKACCGTDCGSWSDWAEWLETFGFPW